MLNVAFFSNQFASQRGHGIKRYSEELVRGFQRTSDMNVFPVAGWSDAENLNQLINHDRLALTGLGRNGTKLAWTFSGWPTLEGLVGWPIDLVHAASLGYPIATKKPFVVTIHDLGPITHPQYFENTHPWVMRKALRQVKRQASRVICVSQFTANEVIDVVGSEIEDRIEVIHEAARLPSQTELNEEDQQTLAEIMSQGPFLLMAGKISPRKNVQGVLAAMSRILDDVPHNLLLVGGDGWGMQSLLDQINRPEMSKRIKQMGFVSDALLHALYANTSAYIYPSLYEGFGLTLLEAMQAGAPVITSNRASMPEIAGDAALLVDPTNEDDLTNAILGLCQDEDLSQRMSHLGLARAGTFTWEKAVRETGAVYEQVCHD